MLDPDCYENLSRTEIIEFAKGAKPIEDRVRKFIKVCGGPGADPYFDVKWTHDVGYMAVLLMVVRQAGKMLEKVP